MAALTRTYTLTVEYEGDYQVQAYAFDPDDVDTIIGAGEGSNELEKMIRTANYSASGTSIKVASLVRT